MEILQWNCNGAMRHFEDLKLIIHNINPAIIGLQETNFTDRSILQLNGYQIFVQNRIGYSRTSGGVAIYVKDSWEVEEIPINNPNNLEIIVIKIIAPIKLTIINTYLPNSNPTPWESLTKILKNIHNNFLIIGDFNAHNPIWGSQHTCTRGQAIEKIIDDLKLFPLNTGSHTHFNVATNNTSAIDLSLCNSKYLHRFDWNVLSEESASDHYPILISYADATLQANVDEDIQPTSWKIRKATTENWTAYATITDAMLKEITIPLHPSADQVDTIVEQISNAITTGAEEAIGRSSQKRIKKEVPWWNDECEKAKKAKNNAFNRWKKHGTELSKTEFVTARKEARTVFTNARKTSWQAYVSAIHQGTPNEEVWRKIKSISGNKNKKFNIESLAQQDGTITSDSSKIADLFADHFASSSASTNFHPNSLPAKKRNT